MAPTKRHLLKRLVNSNRYQQATNRVRRYNSPVGKDDLVAEFNLGVMLATKDVKMNVGDPMEYIIFRGMKHVQMAIRTACNKHMLEECLNCGKVRPYRQAECYTCKERNFLVHPRVLPLEEGPTGEMSWPERHGLCKIFGGGSQPPIVGHTK